MIESDDVRGVEVGTAITSSVVCRYLSSKLLNFSTKWGNQNSQGLVCSDGIVREEPR